MKNDWQPSHEPWVCCRWDDLPDTPEQERQTQWQQLWQVLNLLLPLRHCWAGEPMMQGLGKLATAPVFRADTHYDNAWLGILDLAASGAQNWLAALAQAHCPVPVVGYELTDGKGRIVAEAELAWEALKVVVMLAHDGNVERFEASGWQWFVASDDTSPGKLIASLKEKNQ